MTILKIFNQGFRSNRLKYRGKSGLHRTKCWRSARSSNATDSATENIPPYGKGEMAV